jgi:hypothetical protein
MFPDWDVFKSEQIVCGNYWDDLKDGGRFWRQSAWHLIRLATPFYRPRFWLSYAHRLLWLYRRYRITLLLIRKPSEAGK